MKINIVDKEYFKAEPYKKRVIDRTIDKLENRLQQYLDQNKNIKNIFNDDILIHDIFEHNTYVYKCYINGMQVRLLYTMEGKKLIIIAHYVKKDAPQEWIGPLKKAAKKYNNRYVGA